MTFTHDEAKGLMAEIKENRRKLNACPKHLFDDVGALPPGGGTAWRKRRCCANCGGFMEDKDIVQYARGYMAAGRDPDEVMRFYDGSSLR